MRKTNIVARYMDLFSPDVKYETIKELIKLLKKCSAILCSLPLT